MLSNFDVDLDLPHYRMSFYSKQSCTRAAPAWTAPYAAITAGRSRSDHLFFPVQLDGRRVYAFFDTGSQLSVVSRRGRSWLFRREQSRVGARSTGNDTRCGGRTAKLPYSRFANWKSGARSPPSRSVAAAATRTTRTSCPGSISCAAGGSGYPTDHSKSSYRSGGSPAYWGRRGSAHTPKAEEEGSKRRPNRVRRVALPRLPSSRQRVWARIGGDRGAAGSGVTQAALELLPRCSPAVLCSRGWRSGRNARCRPALLVDPNRRLHDIRSNC